MRKFLFALLLWLPIVAMGQGHYKYRYWFDGDALQVMTGTSASANFSLDIDLSGLSNSLHTIHMQICDTVGVWSSPISRYFVKVGDLRPSVGRYWFDNDIVPTPLSVHDGKFTIDVSKLNTSIHYFHYQAQSTSKSLSSPQSRLFYKIPDKGDYTYYYWVDGDTTTIKKGEYSGEAMMIDVAEFDEGLHVLYFVVKNNNVASPPATSMFIKIPQTEGVEYLTCCCYIDGVLYYQEKIKSSGGIVDCELDVSSLTQGIHDIQVQVLTPSGVATNVVDGYFLRTATTEEWGRMQCHYVVDNGEMHNAGGSFVNGLFHFDLDVESITDGFHNLTFYLSGENGVLTQIMSSFFLKIPVGGTGIKEYRYWLNDDMTTIRETILEERANPLKLISLLPIDTLPIRSSCFHLEMKDSVPILYAKNDIYFQFIDASNRLLQEHKQYIDYNVSVQVENAQELESGKKYTENCPGENEIYWYRLYADEGDSLAFKTDQACTLQLFSPDGEEIYNAQGSTSVKWGGCHAGSDGNYYLAMHDVTGSRSQISLDYLRIEKYAILDQDVKEAGNGGYCSINFDGNGFFSLMSIALVNGRDTIPCVDINYTSDAQICATFDLTGVNIGNYTGIFQFIDDVKVVKNMLEVVPAEDITISTTISYSSTYLRNSTTTYTLKVSNHGNMTAYRVPIYIYVSSATIDGISRLEIEGLDLPGLFDGIDKDSLSTADREYLRKVENEIGDDHYFIKLKAPIDNTLDSIVVRSGYFFTDLAPNSTKNITLNITSNETIEVWFTMPDTWNPITAPQEVSPYMQRSSTGYGLRDSYCCIKESVECVGNIIGDVVGFANKIAGLTGIPQAKALSIADCAIGTINTVISVVGENVCGENDVEKSFYERLKDIKNGISISGLVVGCFEKFLPDKSVLKSLGELSSFVNISTHVTTIADCHVAFTEKKPNCPPNTTGGGGQSTPVTSLDPNDIYGYKAESGSRAVKSGQRDVYYTIEFENDTAFATAPAHTIVVTDTLDGTTHDLATFAPTGIKIGEVSEILDGTQNFVRTIDLRPRINVIAQVELAYSPVTGIARWEITSLDPMTMEPTTNPMDGVLPVNYDGNGIGRLSYEIKLRDSLEHNSTITNRAAIVFDTNDAIITPTWVNCMDLFAPRSEIISCEVSSDTTAVVSWNASDIGSGTWRYDLYAQYGDGVTWWKVADGITDTLADVKIYAGIDHGFYVVATDSAGNVESKPAEREYTLNLFTPTDSADMELTLYSGWNWISHNLATEVPIERLTALGAIQIIGDSDELIHTSTGYTGTLTALAPSKGYKVLMPATRTLALSGVLYDMSTTSIMLREGWNTIGYPMPYAMSVAQALENTEVDEYDCIVGRDGFAIYTSGEWLGSLACLEPGKGYLYCVERDKEITLNHTAKQSNFAHKNGDDGNPWHCDRYKYPDVMPMVIEIQEDGKRTDAEDYYIAAFCGTECRGVARLSDNCLTMNVYGSGGEPITFYVNKKATSGVRTFENQLPFIPEVKGDYIAPYILDLDESSGALLQEDSPLIVYPAMPTDKIFVSVKGRTIDEVRVINTAGTVLILQKYVAENESIDVGALPDGVYIVSARVGDEQYYRKIVKIAR